jgi:transcriptional regulator with XRE-family HTH domain
LRELREAAGLTQAALGERAGIVGSQINKLELGVNQPTFATALALARALGIEVGAFVVAEALQQLEAPRPRGRPKKDGSEAKAAKAKSKKH